jgi:hypothetical protein
MIEKLKTLFQSTEYKTVLTSEPGIAACIWFARETMKFAKFVAWEDGKPSKSMFTPCAPLEDIKEIKLFIKVCLALEFVRNEVWFEKSVTHNVTFVLPDAKAAFTAALVAQPCVDTAFPLA